MHLWRGLRRGYSLFEGEMTNRGPQQTNSLLLVSQGRNNFVGNIKSQCNSWDADECSEKRAYDFFEVANFFHNL